MTSVEREKLLRSELEQSELTREDPPSGKGVRRGRAAVYSLRLPPDVVERLEDLARRRDVPASALARGFVLAGLADAENPETVQTLLRHVDADVAKLRDLVG